MPNNKLKPFKKGKSLYLFLCFAMTCPAWAEAKDPKVNFMMECQGCHAADGSGSISTIPALKNNMAKFLTVPGGRAFLVQVPGAAQAPLSDAETADVLNYMLITFGPIEIANRYPPYTTEEVSTLRKTPLTEVKEKRAALVKLIEKQEKKVHSQK